MLCTYICVVSVLSTLCSASCAQSLLAVEDEMWSCVFILVSFSGHIALFPLLYQPTGVFTGLHASEYVLSVLMLCGLCV